MPTQPHRDTRAAFPNAAPGKCKHCGRPCPPSRRSHVSCAEEATASREHRQAMIDRADGAPVCVYRDRSKCSGRIESHHVQELADNGDKTWTVPACRKHHNEETQRARAARSERKAMAAKSKGKSTSSGGGMSNEDVMLLLACLAAPAALAWAWKYGAAAWAAVTARVSAWWGTVDTPTAPAAPSGGTGWLWALLAVAAAVLAARVAWTVRGKRVAALTDVIARVTHTVPEQVAVRCGLTLSRGRVRYPSTFDDRPGSRAVLDVQDAIERKTGHALTFTWRPARDTLTWRPRHEDDPAPAAFADTEPDTPVDDVVDRLRASLQAQAGKGEVAVTATRDRDGRIQTMTVTYPATVRDDSPDVRAAWQDIVASKITGRWRPDWDTHGNTLVLTRRPPMPAVVPHPTPEPGADPHVLPFAMDEDHQPVAWDTRVSPHFLVAGSTGSGKTVLIRSVITEAVARGWVVYCCDPKRVELAGFRGWPSVAEVATDTEDMIDLVESIHAEMDRRYSLIEAGDKQTDDFPPILLVVDEAREWLDRSNAWWKANRERGQSGTEHPAVEQWRSIARLGRTARVHMLVGIQRPDAKVFGGEARDNYRLRAALGTMSPEGARMMFGATDVARDVPADAKGRVTYDVGRGAREAQTWWTPDPGNRALPEDDRRIVEALRAFPDNSGKVLRRRGPAPAALPAPAPTKAAPVPAKAPDLPGQRWAYRQADMVRDGDTIRDEGVIAEVLDARDSDDMESAIIDVRLADGVEETWEFDATSNVEVRI